MKKKILVIDIGGTNVKLMISRAGKRKFKSGPSMTPREMVSQIKSMIKDWRYDAISIGFPSPVRDGRILSEPKHLGKGWVKFDFEKAFGKPVRVINDAAMQALGSYRDGRMLFLGLGTGLGSLWFGATTSFRWSLEICLAGKVKSSKIISANPAWRGSGRRIGSSWSITRSSN